MYEQLKHKHKFNTATNPELLAMQGEQDRISFSGVTFRNFALRADINRLQMFCDNYLNFVDDHDDSCGHYFKPAAPYVTLSMLNYGRMATESENLGWIAQHEVLFSVPVEWYKVDAKGQLIFQDWAYVCPFIYVDNDQSLGVGREVYGWTKVRAWLQPVTTSWTNDPRKPRRLLSMATSLFPQLYVGQRQEPRTLLEIVQDAPPSLLRSPFSADDPHNPWWSASRNLRRSTRAMYNAFDAVLGLPIFGYSRSSDLGTISRMYKRATDMVMASIPRIRPGFDTLQAARARSIKNPASPYMNNITLKQFRDAQHPDTACYQALVNSQIAIERFADGGLLGGPNLLMGDITGGYQIRLHQYAEQPIIETLGLVVTNTEYDDHGTPVAILSPVLPSWMACDLRYDMGTTLCWRDSSSCWSSSFDDTPHVRPDGEKNRYNTSRSAALQEGVGPFHYPDTTMRVLPMLADKKQLTKFCHEYLNKLNIDPKEKKTRASGEPEVAMMSKNIAKNRFEPWGNYVYMVITTYGDQMGKMYTEQNNLGQTVGREIAFWVPVKWYATDDKTGKETLRVAFITPYVFCDSMRHAITEQEVNGRPVKHSRISSNDEYWLRESGPVADKKMLATLKTLLMPALNMGQPAEMHTLFEVMEGDVAGYNEDIPWAAIKANWKPELENDLKRKIDEKKKWTSDDNSPSWDDLKKIFKSIVTDELPLNFISLKQYRATGQIDKHCYQALVLVEKKIKTLWDLREMSAKMHVGIHKYPTVPIVKQLGVHIKTVQSKTEAVVPQIEPIRPFFLRASTTEEVGTNLYSRVLGQPWQLETPDLKTPSKKLQKILETIDEPKAIIESVLWDSWGGHDTTNPYREWQEEFQRHGVRNEEASAFVKRDEQFEEFFMRPDNFGMGPVNRQVFDANTKRKESDK